MKPILFPFTYVTEATINACRSFFNGISVFQSSLKHLPEPMGIWASQGFLDIRVPDLNGSLHFDRIWSETENWARSHGHGVASFLKSYRDKVPFFESSSVAQIGQDIRAAAGRRVFSEAPQQEALLRARLFLQLAQEFDDHNQWLSLQMLRQEALERDLYHELRGDAYATDRGLEPGQGRENEDSFQYMIGDRLKAWSRVMLSQGHVKGPFVTRAASVLTLIREQISEPETLVLVATIPAVHKDAPKAEHERQKLMDYCEKLVHTPGPLLNDTGLPDTYPGETTGNLSMQLYLLPDMAPRSFFARFVEGALPGERGADAGARNTLIGYIPSD